MIARPCTWNGWSQSQRWRRGGRTIWVVCFQNLLAFRKSHIIEIAVTGTDVLITWMIMGDLRNFPNSVNSLILRFQLRWYFICICLFSYVWQLTMLMCYKLQFIIWVLYILFTVFLKVRYGICEQPSDFENTPTTWLSSWLWLHPFQIHGRAIMHEREHRCARANTDARERTQMRESEPG